LRAAKVHHIAPAIVATINDANPAISQRVLEMRLPLIDGDTGGAAGNETIFLRIVWSFDSGLMPSFIFKIPLLCLRTVKRNYGLACRVLLDVGQRLSLEQQKIHQWRDGHLTGFLRFQES
jgi:hypothetical protein